MVDAVSSETCCISVVVGELLVVVYWSGPTTVGTSLLMDFMVKLDMASANYVLSLLNTWFLDTYSLKMDSRFSCVQLL